MGTSDEETGCPTEPPVAGWVEACQSGRAPKRKAYARPDVLVEGDVRSFVLFGSQGTGDSGDPGSRQF